MTQTVWPLNENGEIVFTAGTGSKNVVGYLNQDVLPSSTEGVPLALESLVNGVRDKASFNNLPQAYFDQTPKLLVVSPFAPTTVLAIVQKNTGGYALISLRNNVTTTADSLATSTTDTTMRRVTSVQNAVSAVVGYKDSFTLTGAWVDQSLGSVLPEIPAFTTASNYVYKQTNANNAVLSFTGTPHDGFITLSFVCTTGSNPAAQILINGTTYTVDLTSATTSIKSFKFPSYKNATTVEIRNTTAGAVYFVNYLGRDFSTLAKWNNAPVNAFGYYRNNSFADYLVSNSENDYVIREWSTNIYGGGYHGGETSILDAYVVDGVGTSPSTTPVVGRSLILNSSCSISWASVGDPSTVDVAKRTIFCAGGYSSEVIVKGAIVCSEFYSALFGASEDFSETQYPSPVAVNNTPNMGRLLMGRTTSLSLVNPSTKQRIVANYYVSQKDNESQYNGAFIWRVDGSYKKMYYALAHDGKLSLNGNSSFTVYNFE